MFFPVSALQESRAFLGEKTVIGRIKLSGPEMDYQFDLSDDTGKNIATLDLTGRAGEVMIWLPARDVMALGVDIKKTLEYHGLASNQIEQENTKNEQYAEPRRGNPDHTPTEREVVRDRGNERAEQSVLPTREPGGRIDGNLVPAGAASAPVAAEPVGSDPSVSGEGGGLVERLKRGVTPHPQLPDVVVDAVNAPRTEPEPEADTPFVLSDEILAESRSPKVKARDNIAAIELLSALDAEKRKPSENERIILARYVGWGGLPNAFRGIDGSIKKGWGDVVERLESALELHALQSARRSTLDAHFTSSSVVQAMWQGVQALGMKPQKISEPSCGAGNFVGFAPEGLQVVFNLVEKETTTFKIASYLYPDANIIHSPFEKTHPIVKPYYDLVIGNPPFGDQRIFDAANQDISGASPNVHSYFFNKSMAMLAPGGVLAMVVSRYLMDNQTEAGRNFRLNLAAQAHLLEAVRLPDTAFAENAGTSVITDILFLQKRVEPLLADAVVELVDSGSLTWVEASSISVPHKDDRSKIVELTINSHYLQYPELILGTLSAGRGSYRDNEMVVSSADGAWKDRLLSLMQSMRAVEAFPENLRNLNVEKSSALAGYPKYGAFINTPGTVVLVNNMDGDPMLGYEVLGVVNHDTSLGYTPIKIDDKQAEDDSGDEYNPFRYVSKAAHDRLVAYVPIRDTMLALIKEQVMQDSDDTHVMDTLRKTLETNYRQFIDRFGLLNRAYNARALQNDVFFPQVSSLERNYKKPVTKAMSERTGEPAAHESAEMADIFFKRTQFPPVKRVESASTAEDALRISLSYTGKINPAYMSSLMKRDWEGIRDDLGAAILLTPDGWDLAESVLSGDVRSKIKAIGMAIDADELSADELRLTLSELEKVIPEDRPLEKIPLIQGSAWIPLDIHRAFIDECFGSGAVNVDYISSLRQWSVERGGGATKDTYTTAKVPAHRMARYFLRDQSIVVKVEGEVSIGDTELARAKMDKLKDKWNEWITANPEQNLRMVRLFNDKFNRFVKPAMSSGQFLETPDRSGSMTLRPTQKAGAWYCIQHKATLLDHAVGAGKTLTAVVAGHEMKRMGLARKIMITAPNGLEGQWVNTIMDNYPNDRIVCASAKDMSAQNRQRFLARIAVDSDIDFIIMQHSSFQLIPRDMNHEMEFVNSEINRYYNGLEAAQTGASPKTIKEIEKKISKMEGKLDRLMDSSISRDRGLTFSDLGVDALFVDESQYFKNIPFNTSYEGVKGLGNPGGSNKAFDMLIKARTLIESGGRYIDMSGTPEANSIAEVYLAQLKHAPESLHAMGIHSFDQWFFAEKQTEFQFSMTGAYKEQTYLNKFNSLHILRQSLASFRHIITIEDVKEQALAAGLPPVKIPRLVGDTAQIVSVQKTKLQDTLIGYQVDVDKDTGNPIFNAGSVLDRVAQLGSRRPEKGEDNILVCISDLNKLSLSSREFLKKAGDLTDVYGDMDDDSPKLLAAQDNIFADYTRWHEEKGTCLVFLDISTPKKEGRVSKETQLVREAVAAVDAGGVYDATDAQISAAVAAEEFLSAYTLDEVGDLLQDGASWSAYVDLKQKLVNKGIPAHEIAFIHDYDGLEKRDELFAKMRSGLVRVLMGSTSKMGAGVNVQNRIIGMHMLDAAYRPDQMEQRIGRMLRQGNELLEKIGDDFRVALYYYVLEGSADAARYQLLANKKKFLDALRGGDEDEISDPESSAFNPQAIMAAASGNQVLQDRAVITSSLKRVRTMLDMIRSQSRNSAYEIHSHTRNIERIAPVLDKLQVFYQQAIDDSSAINQDRVAHDERSENYRSALAQVREDHRVWVSETKVSIQADVTAKLEAESLPGIKVTKKSIEESCRAAYQANIPLWDADLAAKIRALDKPAEGYIDVVLDDGAILKGLTLTQFGQLVQESLHESRSTRKTIVIGDVKNVRFEAEAKHTEVAGTINRVRAYNVSDEEVINVVSNTVFSFNSPMNTGMSALRLIKDLAEEARVQMRSYENSLAYMERHKVKSSEPSEEGHYILQRDFLQSLSSASLGLLRCGVTSWEDGCDVQSVIDLPESYWENEDASPSLVRLAKSETLKEVAKEFIVPHISVIQLMRDQGDGIMENLSNKKPVSTEIIEKTMMESWCDHEEEVVLGSS